MTGLIVISFKSFLQLYVLNVLCRYSRTFGITFGDVSGSVMITCNSGPKINICTGMYFECSL